MTRTYLSRRTLLASSSAATAFMIVPRHVLGAGKEPPSEKVSIAFIGVAGRGTANLDGLGNQNVVALCDVDAKRLGGAAAKHAGARQFSDFRKMLDAVGKNIDAVSISTPDHNHAFIGITAMKMGKHVYCEKPLAHSIYEVRQMRKAAAANKVITQLGNQGHSTDSIRMLCEWIWDGAIGNVHTIHGACQSVYSRVKDLPKLQEKNEVPVNLDWDLWLGPALDRPYNPMYLPGKWRGWTPFGTGVIGDWTCHVIDPVFWALDLVAPSTVTAQVTRDYDPKTDSDTFPSGSVIKYVFPARGKRGPVTIYWHDGIETIPRPENFDKDRTVPTIGAIVLGDKGGITYGSHGAGGLRIFPEAQMKAYKLPEKTLPRPKNHHADWLEAIKANKPAGSNFDYGGPLSELALLGNIAQRFPGQELQWDAPAMKITNNPTADKFTTPVFRKGWEL